MNDAGTLMRACLEAFVSTDAHQQGKRLRQLSESAPRVFASVACALMRDVKDTQSYRYLLALLNSRGLLIEVLRMLSRQDPGAAGAATNLAMRLIPGFDRLLTKGQEGRRAPAAEEEIDPDEFLRGVLETVDASLQLLSAADVELRMGDPRIRSRMSMLAGRIARLWEQFGDLLSDPDPRVRANAVESLWGIQSPMAERIFESALADPHHRVRANALVGQYLLGEQECLPKLLSLSRDPDAMVRAAAAWAMGRTGDARFEPQLQEMRRSADRNPMVIRNALLSISRLQRTEAASPHDPLRISLLSSAVTLRSLRLTLQVSELDGASIDDLRPVHVQIWAGGLPVWHYSLARVNPEPRPVCLLLPLAHDGAETEVPSWLGAVEKLLAHRPASAAWAVAPFSPVPAARSAVRTGEILHLSDADTATSDVTPIELPEFHTETEALSEALTRTVETRDAPFGPLRLAARQAAEVEDHDLMLVIPDLHPSLASNRLVEELRVAAERNRVRVHALLGAGLPASFATQVRSVCRGTDGWSLPIQDPSDVTVEAATLLGALRSHWTVEVELSGEPAPMELRIRTGRYSGLLPVTDSVAHRAA